MPSPEYLEALTRKAKEYLPEWLWNELHRAAFPAAGGKARWREPEEPSFLEKMALAEMRPDRLKDASDDEVRLAWLRLHQWFGAARKRKEPVENIVNAAIWVLQEMENREFKITEDELVEEARKLSKLSKEANTIDIVKLLEGLPEEVLLIKDFVAVVGSVVKGKNNPEDIDVLFRAKRDESGENFLIQADNVWLPVRKALDPEKKGHLHFIDSPQGSHDDYYPCYSLVLRREEPRKKVVKQGEVKIDLGCGSAKPEGYIGIDKEAGPGVDIVHDLEKGIPFPDGSVDEVRAHHVLEHLSDKEQIMAEIWRVLKPGGRLVFEVPSTKGEGAFNHPDHVSYWNKSTFAFWTQDNLLEGRPKFEVEELEEIENGDLVYVRGVLRKPEKVSKAGLAPFEKGLCLLLHHPRGRRGPPLPAQATPRRGGQALVPGEVGP